MLLLFLLNMQTQYDSLCTKLSLPSIEFTNSKLQYDRAICKLASILSVQQKIKIINISFNVGIVGINE